MEDPIFLKGKMMTTKPDFVYTPKSSDSDVAVLKITMEQRGCLVEVCVPEVALPPVMEMKEYMRNTGADMYARLYHMMQQLERGEK